jgi:hypothetical protein
VKKEKAFNSRHKILIVVISVPSFLILIALGFFSFSKIYENKFYPHLSIEGISVSGKSRLAAYAEIESKSKSLLNTTLEIRSPEPIAKYTLRELGVSYDINATLDNAWRIGHDQDFRAKINALKTLFTGKKFLAQPVFNDSILGDK